MNTMGFHSALSWCLSLICLLLVAPSCAVEPPQCPFPLTPNTISPNFTYNYSSPAFQSLFETLDSRVEKFTSQNRIQHYAVSVVHGKKTIYTTGLSTRKFRIASVTKTITALGALMLREQGLLSLDDHVKAFLPDFSVISPYGEHDITIRELMGHAAGLPRDLCNLVHVQCGSNETEILKQVAGMKLIRPPWSNDPAYSNLGIALLGHAWEKATSPRMSWEEFVIEKILKPLGMDDTGIDLDGVELAPSTDPNAKVDLLWARPAAQMYSTAEDLGKYLQFLLTGEPALISQSSIREWISPATIFNDGKAGYAFPWELRKNPDFIEMLVSKSGNIYSYRSHIVFDQPNQLGVAVLAVFEPGTTTSPDAFADAVLTPVMSTVQAVNRDFVADTYAGVYACGIQRHFQSPTLNWNVQVLFGSVNVSVDPSLGLLADAKIALLTNENTLAVNSTWSLLMKNVTDNSFWVGESPSCAAFAGGVSGGPDLVFPNVPGTLYTNVISFDTSKGSLEWPAIGGKCYKPTFSAGYLLHPSSSALVAGLVVFILIHFL